MNAILAKLGEIGIIPVIKIENPGNAVPLVAALIEGGLPCAEITFRTDAAAASIKAIADAFPGFPVGAGTVINASLAQEAVDSGAQFIVSPGFNPAVVDWCITRGIPVIPGVNNPSAIEAALERNLETLKFFPAEASGGTAMLDALSGPFPRVSFIPTGGIDLANLSLYARRANVHAIGGSWMVRSELIEKADWQAVTNLAREAVVAIQGFSFAHLGINSPDAEAQGATSDFFSRLGLAPKEGTSSIFNGSIIEVMKNPFRGAMGHIGFSCWNVERSLAYLAGFGFRPVMETAKYERGRLSVVYLDREVGGFAIHLVRAK